MIRNEDNNFSIDRRIKEKIDRKTSSMRVVFCHLPNVYNDLITMTINLAWNHRGIVSALHSMTYMYINDTQGKNRK